MQVKSLEWPMGRPVGLQDKDSVQIHFSAARVAGNGHVYVSVDHENACRAAVRLKGGGCVSVKDAEKAYNCWAIRGVHKISQSFWEVELDPISGSTSFKHKYLIVSDPVRMHKTENYTDLVDYIDGVSVFDVATVKTMFPNMKSGFVTRVIAQLVNFGFLRRAGRVTYKNDHLKRSGSGAVGYSSGKAENASREQYAKSSRWTAIFMPQFTAYRTSQATSGMSATV